MSHLLVIMFLFFNNRQTKEDRLYGIFGDGDGRPGLGGGGGTGGSHGGRMAFAKPVTFVSAGSSSLLQPDKSGGGSEGSDVEEAAADAGILEELESGSGGVKKQPEVSVRHLAATPAPRTENPFADGQSKRLKASAGTSSTTVAMAAKSAKAPSYSMFSSSRKKVDKEFGKWQKASTGFGQKYLEKFGWKVGQGAGSHGHGIVEPIDIKLRKAKMGLQDSGERTAQSRRDFGGKDDSQQAKQAKFEEELAQWRSTDSGT